MMTIIEKDGWVKWCGKEEATGEMPTKDFFTGGFLTAINEKTVFVYDFQNMAMMFVKALLDAGYADATETELAYEENHKLDRNTFKYLLSRDNLSFYSVSYRVGDDVITLYEFKNLISASLKDVVKDFGGTECVAMYRACIQVRSYAPRSSTVSSCAYSYWKSKYNHNAFVSTFEECGEKAEKICRDAYHGGLCYMSNKAYCSMIGHGTVLDVNSLYSWVMRNSKFAVGKEHYGEGEIPKDIFDAKRTVCYIHFRATFKIKKDHVPFVRTRCDKNHFQLEVLTDSNYRDKEGNVFSHYEVVDEWGEIHYEPFTVELCMYEEEFRLFFEQYDVSYIEYIDYVWWQARFGIFTDYVDEFYEMKKNAKGKAERRISKILQNALSGRMSLKKKRRNSYLSKDTGDLLNTFGSFEHKNKCSSSHGKYTDGYVAEGISPMLDGEVDVTTKSMSHIQIGAAITSIAMCYIVRKAQANYDNFLYTDTDSLHLKGDINDIKDVEIGEGLGQFKIEHRFMYAKYYKLKVYTMMETDENGTAIGSKVTWAGMPEDSQKILEAFLNEMYLRAVVNGGTERDNAIQELYNKARPEGISDDDWNLCLNGWINKVGHDQMYKVSLPHVHKVVKSYKDFSFTNKTEWYQVDIMDKLDIRAKRKKRRRRRKRKC